MNMDWISHLLFGLTLGAILLKDRSRQKMALVAAASLLPDLDILWHHRNDSLAKNIEENITIYTDADGIMLFYPFSNEKFSITLNEESYYLNYLN